MIAGNMMMYGIDLSAWMTYDDIAGTEFLASIPEVDAARIGCTGWSMGAYRAWMLSALFDRIKVGAAVCWMVTTDEQLSFRYRAARRMVVSPTVSRVCAAGSIIPMWPASPVRNPCCSSTVRRISSSPWRAWKRPSPRCVRRGRAKVPAIVWKPNSGRCPTVAASDPNSACWRSLRNICNK